MKKLVLLATFAFAASSFSFAQKKDFTLAFYNVENLFDTIDTPDKRDDEFTPESDKQWNTGRYEKKLIDLSNVIISINKEDYPEIIGLCEVENRQVVEDLVSKTGLKTSGYKVIHEESPDARGIDVAMLYEPAHFSPISHATITTKLPGERPHTRDILYVKGVADGNDTLHIFINHWPSRSGGQEASEPKRVLVAQNLRNAVDSIQQTDADAKIVIMGDLNDHPYNKSCFETLRATNEKKQAKEGDLFNLMYQHHLNGEGSYNYRGKWGVIDHIIVSYALLDAKAGLSTKHKSGVIHKEEFFLFTKKNGSKTPNRTYGGKNYYGGFSDHLPVYVTLKRKG